MLGVEGFSDKVAFIWSVADLLRGDVKSHEYGQFVLPFVVLRRLDCVLEPTKKDVLARAAALEGKVENVGPILERITGAPFYNTSPLTFTELLNDDKKIRANLTSYIAGFSPGAAEVLEKYKFAERINTLDKAGLLYQIVAKFADIDLHPDAVPNHAMGYIFEELLRRFSEMANETAGEHFTPREVVKLMVNILFAEDEKALSGVAPVRTLFDPACGTGGLLSTGQEYLAELNPDAHLEVYGQELNPETWAICRSDMLIKGEKPENIVLGNSLSADGHSDERFDYMLANPPFGVDWKKYADPIVAEAENEGFDGRFGAGLPRTSDGSFLFLQHMLSKMKPVADDPTTPDIIEGGSRIAIVFSGSPLTSGAAGSGESNIRRWIIENDWLEAVVGLPDQLFYNTPIYTYFWVLTNRKRASRRGKVLLLDGRGEFEKMRKGLGDKRKFLSDEAIAEITRLYTDSLEESFIDPRVKVVPNEAFGFRRVPVERPLRRIWAVSDETLSRVADTRAWRAWAPHSSPQVEFEDLVDTEFKTASDLTAALPVDVPAPVVREIAKACAVSSADAEVVVDRRGNPLPDPDLRDVEEVGITEDVDVYLHREVHPHAPDAWMDETKAKVGYRVRFGRAFWRPSELPPSSYLTEQIEALEQELLSLAQCPPSRCHGDKADGGLVRAKWLFTERNERGRNAPLGSVVSDVGVVHRNAREAGVMNPGDDLSTYKLVKPQDFVIGLRSFQHGIVMSEVEALVSPAYTVLVPTREETVAYLRHYLRSRDLIERLEVISSGIRQGRTISFTDFRELTIPLPDQDSLRQLVAELDEQEAWLARVHGLQTRLASLMKLRSTGLMRHAEAGVL